VASPYRILIVSDDPAFAATLAEQLAAEDGFAPALAGLAEDVPAAVAGHAPDLILIDSSEELCRHLRDAGSALPIVMLGGSADEAASLAAGADEHVARPLRLGPLLARLRARIEDSRKRQEADLVIGPYLFRPRLKLLTGRADGRRIRLTEKETAMLLFLMKGADRPAPRDTLLDAIWGYNSGVTTHTLETHVYRLRRKIEADPANAAILVTEPGGYRLVC
jgi:DNA-binding response OmpR family regulator